MYYRMNKSSHATAILAFKCVDFREWGIPLLYTLCYHFLELIEQHYYNIVDCVWLTVGDTGSLSGSQGF